MKRLDMLLVVFFIGIAVIFFGISKIPPREEPEKKYIEIISKGEKSEKIFLYQENIGKRIPIQTDLGLNIIEIGKEGVRIVEADCPDQICVKTGWIKNSGQMIVCLPHKLVVDLKGGKERDIDEYSR